MRIPGSEGKSSETRSLSQYFVIDFSIFSISWMWLEGSSNVRISTVSIANENAKVLDLPEDKNPVCLVYKEKHHFFSPPRRHFCWGIFHPPKTPLGYEPTKKNEISDLARGAKDLRRVYGC